MKKAESRGFIASVLVLALAGLCWYALAYLPESPHTGTLVTALAAMVIMVGRDYFQAKKDRETNGTHMKGGN